MQSITFVDTEINPQSNKIVDMAAIKADESSFHKASLPHFVDFLRGSAFVCGHNVLAHDTKYIGKVLVDAGVDAANIIDTLHLSPLLFPTKPYHALLKDDKLQIDEANNPLNDAIKARDLFYDEVAAFRQLDASMQQILFLLLNENPEFSAFFRYLKYSYICDDIQLLINNCFREAICGNCNLSDVIEKNPVELAYCLSIINSYIVHDKVYSITPPWVLRNYPEVERLMYRLRNKPCIEGCAYCHQAFDIHKGLKHFFGYDAYRSFGGEALQEKAVKATVHNKSILAVFPTGGGKSITFQVPALMCARNSRSLTVVISPLQSLMKDQVDNLEKLGITEAVTINGLLDPIERAKSFERIEDGSASVLYISPESLRSRTIERLILGRKIARFVIDEAHCFSSWGQDFRVDYLYIGDFIRNIQEKKNLHDGIPVSCFTATAKQRVIEDIQQYFNEKLSLDLELFSSKSARTNLHYKVFENNNDEEKYQKLRDLIEEKNCPTIIYVSRTRKAYKLSERLTADGFDARPYHGKMDVKEKTANQDAFIAGQVSIMVATSAFGMGVDKKDVGMVVHYEISDSLENYIQEAGRAGRNENIEADCYVLFNEEDLGKHFILLNQSKISIKEIQQIWKAIKDITRFRSSVSNSSLEIARKAGWDDTVVEIETRVTTAIAALEEAGYLKRGQNMPRVFANSILSKNAQEAIDKINLSHRFEEKQKEKAVRIMKKLFSSKNRRQTNDETPEARVDYISDHLGIVRQEVINIVNLLREENILADAKDLTAYVKRGEQTNRSLNIVEAYAKIEKFLLTQLDEQEKTYHSKELNEAAEQRVKADVGVNKIKTILNFWAIKNWIKQQHLPNSKSYFNMVCLQSIEALDKKMQKRHELARFVVEFLYEKTKLLASDEEKEEVLIEFSVHELKAAYENSPDLFKLTIDIDDVEDALFYLSRIDALKIEGGFLVVYNSLNIERLEPDNKKRYTKDDYEKLNQFYDNKVQQIHIVGEYAKKMIADYRDALQFVDDYFQLNYASFLRKYFPGSKADQLSLKMTPAKFNQLFGELSPTQLKIINDNDSKNIVVAAGPGSGKTRVLVHKLASLLLMEDVKHEQLLMLTFSRAAATEFKIRLIKLIGNAANYLEIKTFHSYCFDILGRMGTLEKSDQILQMTVAKIRNREVEMSRITKTVLVIDEAQDMNADEYELVTCLMEQNEDLRVIAVGDDDQNIYEFRGSSAMYLKQFMLNFKATKHELVDNYRSKRNLVEFSNIFASKIKNRLKNIPVVAVSPENGRIKIVQYQCSNLVVPLVNDIAQTSLRGSCCVLTKTNDEALQVTGLLLRQGLPARLIQSNDGFGLSNLLELRFFITQIQLTDDVYIISDDLWENAKRALRNKFQQSDKLEICNNIIKDFELTNTKKKYKSDFEVFVRESRLEDFYGDNGETIFVSTMHKAKGREFDNVFLLLDDYKLFSEESKRLLYVAMTRAKNNLCIHYNADFFNNTTTDTTVLYSNNQVYDIASELIMHLGLKDVWLGFFTGRQHTVAQLHAGAKLYTHSNGCYNASGHEVLRFSQQFQKQVDYLYSIGYKLMAAKVNYLLYWKNDESEKEILIVLPELLFEKIIVQATEN
jgi:ATP-dependent DNA helicase RecQ